VSRARARRTAARRVSARQGQRQRRDVIGSDTVQRGESRTVTKGGNDQLRVNRSARQGPSPLCSCRHSERIFGSPVGTSWDGGQRPRSLSNGCGHWPGPSWPAGSARVRRPGRRTVPASEAAADPGGQAGPLPLRAGRFRPASASLQPGMRYSPERMARRCEALSPDIPGGLQCLAFTPERCSKRRLCRRHC
jgi:hypothetical protein